VDGVVDNPPVPPVAPIEALWERAAEILRGQLSESTWHMWLAGIEPVGWDGHTLRLAVASSVVRDRIVSSYEGMLRQALEDAAGVTLDLDVMVSTAPRNNDPVVIADAPHVVELADDPAPTDHPTRDEHPADRLNPRYTFENFVTGASNRFAAAAALSAAEKPALSYNPLFIYGHAGLGKTHLLHAIGHYVRQVYPEMLVRYVPTETFMNEFVDAIRSGTAARFKRHYRAVDVLLIDDIQFIENKEGLQEEFFHTFNDLHGSDKQIVISSDRPPKAIATLEDRLRSRFEWGLSIDVQPPDFETRLAILRKKAEAERYEHVPPDILNFIASNIRDNVRELEGALIRVTAYSRLNSAPLTEDLARQVLADLLPGDEPRVITPALILDETARMFGWAIDDLCGKSRRRPLVTARQIAMYVFRELTDYSYPQIAREFGGRDHTTVMHAVEKITAQMAERRQIYEQVSELSNRIKHPGP
jgi:chromosomal replication initiator protein